MTSSQIIVLATPVFLLLIALEYLYGRRRARQIYRWDDAINSISLGMLSQISALFTRVLRVGLYSAVYSSLALWPGAGFWHTGVGWLAALVFYDLCYYWLHRLSHEVAVLWAAHAVHHQSQAYNLSTALRQTSSGALFGWIFFLPMAIVGVPPAVVGAVALIDLLYQYWVHTELVGSLGWFDRWFCSPSNHRVHHAMNERYLDRNYGGILIVWDRLFGSFREEDASESCVYGTRSALNSWDPLWANAQVYWTLAQDCWRAPRWSDKLRVWFKPPGWRPASATAHGSPPVFQLAQVTTFQSTLSRSARQFAAAQFAALLGTVGVYLWLASALSPLQAGVWFVALSASLWALGAQLQGRISCGQVLLLEAAVLATASSALELTPLHHVFKPLTLCLALWLVARFDLAAPEPAGSRQFLVGKAWLMAALTASLAGDVFLMFEGFFIPGLLSFLLAHLAYLVLLRQDAPWFPSRRALAATLGVGASMFAFLCWGGLPSGLRAPVAAYVSVIALMAAQALGRAGLQQGSASRLMAAGAVLFMLSDALLATNKFVLPLSLAQFWVLSTYYAAQLLLVGGWMRRTA